MGSDEGVKYWVVQDADTSFVVSQVMPSRLIVVVKDKSAAACDDTLGWLSDRHTVNLIQWAVEGLNCREGAHIPYAEHTRDIARDDLVGAGHPLHTYQ